ncbi:hypothetical protein P7C73_g38, partial [Tremellales sp. Uapishka_1]
MLETKMAAPPHVDDYELQPASHADEPLLPRYEQHQPLSPHKRHQLNRQHSRLRRLVVCLSLSLIIAVPTLALAACYFGRLDKIAEWQKLPDDVKSWIQNYLGQQDTVDKGAFPTNVGYAGPTPTGSEPYLLATAPALPLYSGTAPLIPPVKSQNFNIIQHWGNLSPYYSVASHGLAETNSLIPEGCELKEMHWLQRHGARYPTSGGDGPAGVSSRLRSAEGWTAKGDLQFLNDWSYKLGAELLTPFGRSQLFNLGVAARVKYGFLLDKMDGRLPVFRTESQDRMLRSAQNFATGFFGFPAEEQYNLEVMIEAPGFNCTLAPYSTCLNENNGRIYKETFQKLAKWDAVFLKDAAQRLQGMIDGYNVTVRDAKDFMEMCAYETVSLGYSSFCNLFTEKEWKGFEYRNDIYWWYASSFGSPVSAAQGIGWVQEVVSRLTHTRLTEFNATTNSTFHNDVHFPLSDPLYVDFTHDTTFAQLLPAMNLTTFSESGPPPLDKIPKHRSFIASKICPFATNLQLQVLSCPAMSSPSQIRMILNDAPVPLTGINGCEEDEQGLCDLDAFTGAMKTLIGQTDYSKDCGSDYEYTQEDIVDGRPPRSGF